MSRSIGRIVQQSQRNLERPLSNNYRGIVAPNLVEQVERGRINAVENEAIWEPKIASWIFNGIKLVCPILFLMHFSRWISQPVINWSVAWIELGNDLCTRHISLDKFHTLLRQRLPPLHHIQLETVSVVDHLGQKIPIPTIFCSTWKVTLFLLFIIEPDITHFDKSGL